MTILLTGGSGNTAIALAKQLKKESIPFLATSRKGRVSDTDLQDVQVAELDFAKSDTFDKPFQHPFAVSLPIHAMYIVVPGYTEPSAISAFITHAVKHRNVSKIVLLGGQGGDMNATFPPCEVWRHIDQIDVDYAVLQPSWFNENLFKEYYLSTIKNEGKLYSAVADGKMGFIAAEDIAAAAFALLTSDQPLKKESLLIIGPELLTYDEIADQLSKGLSRRIEHVRVSQATRAEQLLHLGLGEERAKFVSVLEVLVRDGMCAIGFPSDNVRKLTGREPQSISQWIEQHKQRFM